MSRSVETILNEFNPNKGPSGAQLVSIGKALRTNSPQFATGVPVADVLVLPDGEKAMLAVSGFALTGGTAGPLDAADLGTVPAITTVGVDGKGDLVFAAADAVTLAEVTYIPAEGDVIEEEIDVSAAGVAAFLQGRRGVLLLEATLLTGTTPGAKTIDFRGVAPAVTEAALTDAGQPAFNGVDVGAVPVRATVKYVAAPGVGTGVADSLVDRLSADADT